MNYISEFEVTAENYSKFIKRVHGGYQKWKVVGFVIAAICFAVLIANFMTQSIAEISFLDNADFLLCFCIGMICFFLSFVFGAVTGSAKKAYEKTVKRGGEVVKYEFNEQAFAVTHTYKGTEFGNSVRANYFFILWVKEYEDMWIINYDGVAIYYMVKGASTEGSDGEFSECLKRMIGEKYKVVGEKKK